MGSSGKASITSNGSPTGSGTVPDRHRTGAEQDFKILADTLPVGVFVLGHRGALRFANRTLHKIYGREKLTGFDWLEPIHADDREHLQSVIERLHIDHQIDTKIRIVTPEGDVRWCRIAARDLRADVAAPDTIVGIFEDVTEIRSLHNRLEYRASTDALTSLPNRATLLQELRDTLSRSQMNPGFTAVLFIDLDGFKLINDTQGHSVGDLLLQSVAGRFAASLRPGDLVARFGGDEFVVVARNVADPSVAEAVAARLHEVLRSPITVNNQPLVTTASIGVALSNAGTSQADELLANADMAMYEAKRLGRRRTALYQPSLREEASQRYDITADLPHARLRRELRVEYQPIFELADNTPAGAEALIRWDHPAYGQLLPGSFIPLAEESGLILDLGAWVVEQACADLARLRHKGVVGSDFFMTINLSAMQLSHLSELAAAAHQALDSYGLKARDLVFELTDAVPVDAIPGAAERVRQLKANGFRLAIDDFGTGYASLEYLTQLPFDIMKIDPSFTARIAASDSAAAVLESIMVMADRLNFTVVAAGIEDEAHQQLVADAGVTFGQGHLYCRPQPISQLIAQLGAHPTSIGNTG